MSQGPAESHKTWTPSAVNDELLELPRPRQPSPVPEPHQPAVAEGCSGLGVGWFGFWDQGCEVY